jgi:hypothetical protein
MYAPLNGQLELAGYEVAHVDTIGVHYSLTIKKWFDNWVKNKDKIEALLSVLVYFYYKLQKYYDGDMEKIISPHIEQDTSKYFENQDIYQKFIRTRIISKPDHITEVTDICDKFGQWSLKVIGKHSKESHDDLLSNFRVTDLQDYYHNMNAMGMGYFKGIYVLDYGEKIMEDYVFLFAKKTPTKKNISHARETPSEYYERFCREFEEELSS